MVEPGDLAIVVAYHEGEPIPMGGCPVCGKDHGLGAACDERVLRAIDAAHRAAGSFDDAETE